MTTDERLEFLIQSAASHDRQIGELTAQVADLGRVVGDTSRNIDKLVTVSNEDAAAIQALARIAEAHEGRISRLEDGL